LWKKGGKEMAVLAVDLHNSNLGLKALFPVLMANLLQYFEPYGPQTTLYRPGDTVTLTDLPPQWQLVTPNGSQKQLTARQNTIVFNEPGFYSAQFKDERKYFACNLLAPVEADLSLPPPRKHKIMAGSNWWIFNHLQKLLLFLALVLGITEWLLFQQRLV
jgi:hypothetical protein